MSLRGELARCSSFSYTQLMHDSIIRSLEGALTALSLPVGDIELTHPTDLLHGDYATSAALSLAKASGMAPAALAQKIISAMELPAGITKAEVAGPGFINFHLSRNFFSDSIAAIAAAGPSWGKNGSLAGKKVIVEYTQPNPFKPFHIGHLMSNAIGESLSRLVEHSGATLSRMNYQGDIGPHVAKCIWGLQQKNLDPNNVAALGEAYAFGAGEYEANPEAKQAIDQLNRKLYENAPELQEIYAAGRKASLAKFEELYALLGTKFDHYFFESATAPVGLEIVQEAKGRGIFEESDGAVVYPGEKHGLHTRVFITSQGTPTYEAKEIGLTKLKKEAFPFDLNITVTANEQDGYFKVVYAAIEELWPDLADHMRHVSHGMMLLPTGKMSSRKGVVITGESLIADMQEKAREKMQGRELGEIASAVADSVAVGAIKYEILKQSTGKNISFNPESSLSVEGDSGPYLQYAHTRALSVLEKAKKEAVPGNADHAPEEPFLIERLLYRFPEVVARALTEYEPHHIATYLILIASEFNSFYAKEKIVDTADAHSPYKVALTRAVAATLERGLWLLGIRAPEKM